MSLSYTTWKAADKKGVIKEDKEHHQLLRLIGQEKAAGVTVAKGLCSFIRMAKQVVLEVSKLGQDRLRHIEAANGLAINASTR